MEISVNGKKYAVAAEGSKSLLRVLREDLGLTGLPGQSMAVGKRSVARVRSCGTADLPGLVFCR
ncbi:MAG: hypothetical protein OHK0029_27930 [Armatimonadaceae bacterium]